MNCTMMHGYTNIKFYYDAWIHEHLINLGGNIVVSKVTHYTKIFVQYDE